MKSKYEEVRKPTIDCSQLFIFLDCFSWLLAVKHCRFYSAWVGPHMMRTANRPLAKFFASKICRENSAVFDLRMNALLSLRGKAFVLLSTTRRTKPIQMRIWLNWFLRLTPMSATHPAIHRVIHRARRASYFCGCYDRASISSVALSFSAAFTPP